MAIINSNIWRSVIVIPFIVGVLYALGEYVYELWMVIVVSVFMIGLVGVLLYRQKQLQSKVNSSNDADNSAEVDGSIRYIDTNDSALQELYKDDNKDRLVYWELEEFQHAGRFRMWVKRAAGITGGSVEVTPKESKMDLNNVTVDVPTVGVAKEYSIINKLPVGSFGKSQHRESDLGSLYVNMPQDWPFNQIEIGSEESPPEPIKKLLESTENISSDSLKPISSNILGSPNVRGDRRFKFASIPIDSDIYVSGEQNSSDFGDISITTETEKQSILTPRKKDSFLKRLDDKIDAISIFLTGLVISAALLSVLLVL